ncbi:MAG: T9SS type A sorting domain-containing protein [Ignavibacteriales bacterium]|nr:T9SS type A sorting domain-containing protein [Ignavibacteriales bacterium]
MDAQNLARGLTSNGYPIINPTNNLATKFPFSGDPLTGEGWIYNTWTSGGAGFVFFSGPFNMAPNDTQWVMIALIPAYGNTGLNSIEILREKTDLIRSLSYDSLAYGSISYSITDIDENFNIIPENFSLSQNYPNPFNPSTSIQYAISSTQCVTLKVYDVLGNEVATLVNEYKPAGMYNVQFTMNNLASGIYFYRLQAGSFVQTMKMVLIK